jgi:hypothetical protein
MVSVWSRAMQLINLTPEPVRIRLPFPGAVTIPPSGRVARVSTNIEPESAIYGRLGSETSGAVEWRIPVAAGVTHHVDGLPAPSPGVAYLVTRDVLVCCVGRTDVYLATDRGLTGAPAVVLEDEEDVVEPATLGEPRGPRAVVSSAVPVLLFPAPAGELGEVG